METPDAPGVWYDRTGKRWAMAAERIKAVGIDRYERFLAVWKIDDGGCEAIRAAQRDGDWVKLDPPPAESLIDNAVAALDALATRLEGDADFQSRNPQYEVPSDLIGGWAAAARNIASQLEKAKH